VEKAFKVSFAQSVPLAGVGPELLTVLPVLIQE